MIGLKRITFCLVRLHIIFSCNQHNNAFDKLSNTVARKRFFTFYFLFRLLHSLFSCVALSAAMKEKMKGLAE